MSDLQHCASYDRGVAASCITSLTGSSEKPQFLGASIFKPS